MSEYGRQVTLKHGAIEIDVAPELGFSLVGFRWKGLEILDTSLKKDFLEIRKGLGPLILPHFNQFAEIPRIDKQVFPHVRRLEEMGVKHPFQHGIGRYVPWTYSVEHESVTGSIDGTMSWNGYTLSELTGFPFKAAVTYTIIQNGIEIAFDIEGEKSVAAGIHFYYNLFDRAQATAQLPDSIVGGPKRLQLAEPVSQPFPLKRLPQKEEVACTLMTERYSLVTSFQTGGMPEDSFETLIVFCPEKTNFVCIEPISYVVGEANPKKRFHGKIRLLPAEGSAKG
ncbi:MAG TPA: hypothetical protein VMX75_16005 [Spirochaetia bacterium]|nr:hypothetical protein [Spirochaetia bacterium]